MHMHFSQYIDINNHLLMHICTQTNVTANKVICLTEELRKHLPHGATESSFRPFQFTFRGIIKMLLIALQHIYKLFINVAQSIYL